MSWFSGRGRKLSPSQEGRKSPRSRSWGRGEYLGAGHFHQPWTTEGVMIHPQCGSLVTSNLVCSISILHRISFYWNGQDYLSITIFHVHSIYYWDFIMVSAIIFSSSLVHNYLLPSCSDAFCLPAPSSPLSPYPFREPTACHPCTVSSIISNINQRVHLLQLMKPHWPVTITRGPSRLCRFSGNMCYDLYPSLQNHTEYSHHPDTPVCPTYSSFSLPSNPGATTDLLRPHGVGFSRMLYIDYAAVYSRLYRGHTAQRPFKLAFFT